MKKVIVFCLTAIVVCSCGNNSHPGEAKAAPEPPKTAAGTVTLDADAQKVAGIEVAELRPSTLPETVTATGQMVRNEDRTWHVGAITEGRVVQVLVNAGDPVREGQVLARLHSHEVHDSRADFRKAESELSRLQTLEAHARRLRDRAVRLFDLKAASHEQVDSAETELKTAEARVASGKTELEKARVHLTEFLEVSVEDEDKGGSKDHDYIPIKAPASGVVVERKATPGTVVTAGDQVFTITDMSSLWMIAAVNEADLGQLRPNQPLRIAVRAYPDQPFSGRVLRLGEALDPSTRTLQVRVLVPNKAGRLKPEMFATAEIDRGRSREALFIPESAVQDINGNRAVFVRTAAGEFAPRAIETGRAQDGRFEVLRGVNAGDQIVTKGSFVLKTQLLRSTLEKE
jgi:cobalt-zinc-cadmium efflux system membrane fusion protein